MFRRYKDGQNITARLILSKLKETNSVPKTIQWLYRNYPEAVRKVEK